MESFCEYTDKGNKKICRVFDKIENDITSYLIGFMACDGAFINTKYPFMAVNNTEKHIIYSFMNRYCPDKPIYNIGKNSSVKVDAINDVYLLRFPAKMNESFKKFGIFDYKSSRRFIGVKDKFLYSYIAGCIDADGFITVGHRKDCRTPRLRWFLTHGSELFLSDLQNVLSRHDLPTTLRQHGENAWRLQAQHTDKNKIFLWKVCSFLRNVKKNTILNNYLDKYFVPQASDELLEP